MATGAEATDTMILTRFQTDKRLWKRIAGVLFAVGWFIPSATLSKNGPLATAGEMLVCCVQTYWDPTMPREMFFIVFLVLLAQITVFGVAAVVAGWILQCVVVMVRKQKCAGEKTAG